MKPLLILFIVFSWLLSCDLKSPETALPVSEDGEWKAVYSSVSGYRSFIYREKPSSDLLVYVPESRSGTEELNHLTHLISEAGYHSITIAAEPENNGISEEDFTDVLLVSIRRPNYRKRILMIHTKQLEKIIKTEGFNLALFAGLILLDNDKKIQKDLLTEISSLKIPALLVTSKNSESVRNSFQDSTFLISVNNDLRKTPLPESLVKDDTFYSFLLLVRYSHNWIPASEAFPGGCRHSDKGFINLKTSLVNARAHSDFCPLFLISLRTGILYRAADTAEGGCIYSVPGSRSVLLCRL